MALNESLTNILDTSEEISKLATLGAENMNALKSLADISTDIKQTVATSAENNNVISAPDAENKTVISASGILQLFKKIASDELSTPRTNYNEIEVGEDESSNQDKTFIKNDNATGDNVILLDDGEEKEGYRSKQKSLGGEEVGGNINKEVGEQDNLSGIWTIE